MATDYNTCGICFLSYNEVERKPLVLPCSHSFCQECLQQLDALSNKRCSFCKKSWQDIAVADLIFCRQLISPQDSVEVKLCKLEVCGEHGVGMLLWCDSCHVPLCIKCLSSEHSKCQCLSIKEKRDVLDKEFLDSLQKMKCFILFYEKASVKCADDLIAMNAIKNDLAVLKQDCNNSKQDCDKWLESMKKKVAELETTISSTLLDERTVSSLKQKCSEIQMPQIPDTLLVQVIRAYTVTGDNTAVSPIPNFIKNLNISLKSTLSASSTGSDGEGVDGQPRTPELKEGEEWTLRDCSSAAAAIATLTSTSVRPSSVTVRGLIHWPIQNVEEIFKVLARLQCNVTLFMFNCFAEVSDNSREATQEIVYLMLRNTLRCRLDGVWGHLSNTDVERLSKSVTKIGFVISSKEDVQVINSIANYLPSSRNTIDIVILQSVHPADLTFGLSVSQNKINQNGFTYSTVALHFPNLVYIGWMVDVMDKIPFLNRVKYLHLPGTTVSPDAVLGVLRDCNLSCTVHLPSDIALEYDMEELEKRFKKYYCSIVWDINCADCLSFGSPKPIELY